MGDRCRIGYMFESNMLPMGSHYAWSEFQTDTFWYLEGGIQSAGDFLDIRTWDLTALCTRTFWNTVGEQWARNIQPADGLHYTNPYTLFSKATEDKYFSRFFFPNSAASLVNVTGFESDFTDKVIYTNPPVGFVSGETFDARKYGSYSNGYTFSTNGSDIYYCQPVGYATEGGKPLILKSKGGNFLQTIVSGPLVTSGATWQESFTGVYWGPNNSLIGQSVLGANLIPYSVDDGDTWNTRSITNIKMVRAAIYVPSINKCVFHALYGASNSHYIGTLFSEGGWGQFPNGNYSSVFTDWSSGGDYGEPALFLDRDGRGFVMIQNTRTTGTVFFHETTGTGLVSRSSFNIGGTNPFAIVKLYGPFLDNTFILQALNQANNEIGYIVGHPATGWSSFAATVPFGFPTELKPFLVF